jgi:hypothetical protein
MRDDDDDDWFEFFEADPYDDRPAREQYEDQKKQDAEAEREAEAQSRIRRAVEANNGGWFLFVVILLILWWLAS